MDEAKPKDEAELKRPDDAVEDLEPDQHEADEVTGGSSDIFMKYGS